MKTRYWHIEGYDSLRKIYDKKVKVGCYPGDHIEELLRALAARAGLSCNEIVGAHAKKGTKVANDLLVVTWSGSPPTYRCGDNPYFLARVIVQDD